MKKLILFILFNLLLISNSHAGNDIKIVNPWIPEAPPGAGVMAGYMEIHNSSTQIIDIVAISSPAFNRVEMHLSKEVDGFAKMLPQKMLSVPAKGKLILKPGSYHLMLIKPKKRLLNGDVTQLNFTLSNDSKLGIDISIQKMKMQSQMRCAAGKCGGK